MPLVFDDSPNIKILLGLFTFSGGCGDPRLPGVYIDVASFDEWIRNTIIEPPELPETTTEEPGELPETTTEEPGETTITETSEQTSETTTDEDSEPTEAIADAITEVPGAQDSF